ncbi:MAG: hypothetical protein Q9209_002944 [Squamulea sp. 1 TL-2023]
MDRQAAPETRLVIDEAILDYLIYTAIVSSLKLLDVSSKKEHKALSPVQMVDAFLPIFRSLHSDHHAPPDIQFRLRLLQFTYVFVQHYQPSSAMSSLLRPQNIDAEDPKGSISANARQKQHYDMSLEKTLPLFLALSAAQNALQGSAITEIWMILAAGYMAQSYMEQVIVYQNKGADLLKEAFTWGYDADCRAKEDSDEWQINRMFGADESSIQLWESIKEEHIQAVSPSSIGYCRYLGLSQYILQLRPPDNTLLVDHLESLASGELSVVAFREKIVEFLTGLLSAHQAPLLIQLERGKVDGLSRKATAALKKRTGFVDC